MSDQVPLLRFLRSGAGAAVLWVLGSLLAAALVAPWLHDAGKWFASQAGSSEWPAAVESVAASCARAEMDRYFNRSLLVSALALLPWLTRRLRTADGHSPGRGTHGSWDRHHSQQILAGFVIGGAAMGLLGFAALKLGAMQPREIPAPWSAWLTKALLPAAAVSVIEEWIFRGILLGLWLRLASPAVACTGTAAMFSFLHFLDPPGSARAVDALSGFHMLGSMLSQYTDPRFLIADFGTLFAAGLLLGWLRIRSGTLWLPIGIHAGWVFALKGASLLMRRPPGTMTDSWLLGDSLRSGLLPMLMVLASAAACMMLPRPRITRA